MPMLRVAALAAAGMLSVLPSLAGAAEYEGVVPPGLKAIGESWPASNAAQILMCPTMTPASLKAKLSPEARTRWFGICANANKVQAQFKSGDCWNDQSSAACRVAIAADSAIRRDPEFWALVNALMGRPDDYGLDEN